MARLGRRRLARETVRLLVAQPDRQAQIMQQLAAYLVTNKMEAQADLLMQDIADELFLQSGHISATADVAHEPSDDIRAAITDLLTTVTGAKTVELHTAIKPELLGGVVVRTPRQELDASVKRQLNTIAGGIK